MANNKSISAQLTIESLVKKLEKFRKDMTGEFVALLNSSLEPIWSSIESIGATLTAQAVIISKIKLGLSEQSDWITQLEHDVNAFQSKLTFTEKENTVLKAKIESLISHSKHHNIRVVGLPEGIEEKSAREFMTNLLSELLGDSLAEPCELDLTRTFLTRGTKSRCTRTSAQSWRGNVRLSARSRAYLTSKEFILECCTLLASEWVVMVWNRSLIPLRQWSRFITRTFLIKS